MTEALSPAVLLIKDGKVFQRYEDVRTEAELVEKYGAPGDGVSVEIAAAYAGMMREGDGTFRWVEIPDAAELRMERDTRLGACDWTQMPDAPLSDIVRAAWAAYRQALRDLPEQPGWPAAITWPTAPAV